MKYELPDEETLAKYMHLLQAVLLAIRNAPQAEASALADAVHNLPDLLLRWPDFDQENQAANFRRIEETYPRWRGPLHAHPRVRSAARLAAEVDQGEGLSRMAGPHGGSSPSS